MQILAWSYGDVVFNELMWMGTSISPYDEFLELRNMTDTPLNFSVTPWAIYRMDDLMLIIDSGVLPARGLFLICRRDSSESLITASRNFSSNALVLTNSNTRYSLHAGTSSSSTLIDIADDGEGVPMSGRFIPSENIRWSMERNDPPGHGDAPENWHPACLSIGFTIGAHERGTPGAPNYKNIPPTMPNVTISPIFISNDTTITAEAHDVFDPDDIPGPLRTIFDWFDESGIRIFTETDSTTPFASSLSPTLTEPGKTYSLEVYSFDGTDSTGPAIIENIRIHFEKGDLVINELAWAGSMLSPDDQWLEIYNNSGWPINFSQTPIELLSGSPGTTSTMLTIEDGLLPHGGYFLISKLTEDDPRTALNIAPSLVDERLALRDDSLYLALADFPGDDGHIIDEIGTGYAPFAGMSLPDDSVKYSMARNSPADDGIISSSWHTAEVSIGFKPYRLERGSPGSENTRNTPPYMQWLGTPGFVDDGLEPHVGTMDTIFTWRVKYFDPKNSAPEWIELLLDIDCDGTFDSPGERIPMFRAYPSTETDFSEGVQYKALQVGLPPAPSSCSYTFRASDGLVLCAMGIPALEGPTVNPTLRLSMWGGIWRPPPVLAGDVIVTSGYEMPFMFNTGDTPFELGLAIAQADIYPHSSDTSSFSAGGWDFSERPDSAGINEYRLSALFTYPPIAPEPEDFNDTAEDLITSEVKWFDGDTLGFADGNLASIFHPKARWRLAFRLDTPHEAYGFYRYWEHRITVRIYMRQPLP